MSARAKAPQVRAWEPLFRSFAINRVTGEPQELPPLQEIWGNHTYSVTVQRHPEGHVIWLGVRRRDRKPLRDWRHMQRIKNEIAGREVEAVELFPAESRLVDTANEFWLWCAPPGEKFPMGFDEGRVTADEIPPEHAGAVQRPGAEWTAS